MDGAGNLDEAEYAAEVRNREEHRHRKEMRKADAGINLVEYQVDRMRWRFGMDVAKLAAAWLGLAVASVLAAKAFDLLG